MKNKKHTVHFIIGCIITACSAIALLWCLISAVVFYIQNPNMTKLSRVIEFPEPLIVAFISIVCYFIGNYLITKD